MSTFRNGTEQVIELTYMAGENEKHHSVEPGSQFTFDDEAENGQTIRQQLEAGGAQEVPQPE